jgi:hypothetical protein
VAIVDFCHTLQAADWDLDGDVDLVAGGMIQSEHRGLRLLLNSGRGASWTTEAIQTDGSYSAETGDIDQDGDHDLVGIRNWNSGPSWIYRNNARAPAVGQRKSGWRYQRVTDKHVRTFGLCFPDIDGDGQREIASGPFVYLRSGPPGSEAWGQATLPSGVHAFAALDVDGDRLADLLAQRDNATDNRVDLFWLEATDSSGKVWTEPIVIGSVPRSDHPEGFQGSRVGQIVAGGPPELAVSTLRGVFYFAIPAKPTATTPWPRTFVAANDSDEGIDLADIDADGHLDVSFTSGRTKQVRWARNPGNGRGDWQVFTIGEFAEADYPDRCAAADFNGDGRVDLLVTEENAGQQADALACWWEQPAKGAERGNWPRHTLATGFTFNSLDVADVDGDGDQDVVLAEHRGRKRISLWLNDGRGRFSEQPVGEGHESHLGARLVDLDGDGDLDLASIAYDGFQELHVWWNERPTKTD